MTVPAAVVSIGKNFGSEFAATSTALYPAMLLCDDSESIGCARVTRGIASMLKAVVRLAASARTVSAFVSGWMVATNAAPSRRSPISSADGFCTLTTRSVPKVASRDPITAPAVRYASSSCPLPVPAPDSTTTSVPAFVSFATASGTSATRRSPGTVSRGTPTFI